MTVRLVLVDKTSRMRSVVHLDDRIRRNDVIGSLALRTRLELGLLISKNVSHTYESSTGLVRSIGQQKISRIVKYMNSPPAVLVVDLDLIVMVWSHDDIFRIFFCASAR